MTGEEFDTVRALFVRTRAVLDGIHHLCLAQPDMTPTDVSAQLTETEETLAGLIDVVQNRRRASWEAAHPPPPVRSPRQAKALASVEVEPHATVERFTMNGRRPGERPPAPTGKWRQGWSGIPARGAGRA